MTGLNVEVNKSFARGTSTFELRVKAEFGPGLTLVLGASGAGKTTLLNCIAGLERPHSGRIQVGGDTWFDSSRNVDLPLHRRRAGYVFQDLALFPHLTVEGNVGYGLVHLPVREQEARIARILQAFAIEHLRRQRPGNISAGERQRVALARALVTDPAVLLLDEPLSALDDDTKALVVADLLRWNDEHQIPILCVTHSRSEAHALGGYAVALKDGRIAAEGAPWELFRSQTHPIIE